MNKKIRIAINTVISVLLIALIYVGICFCIAFLDIPLKTYPVDNVYEEIWNAVVDETRGDTSLSDAMGTVYLNYEFGRFMSIRFEDRSDLIIGRYGSRMHISISNKCMLDYDIKTNTLEGYGEDVFYDMFLEKYFGVMGKQTRFNDDDWGKYTKK